MSFRGEGELPSAYILSYTHTSATIRVPPGVGRHSIAVAVGNTVNTGNLQQWRYLPPSFTGLSFVYASTDGGDTFVASGNNTACPRPLHLLLHAATCHCHSTTGTGLGRGPPTASTNVSIGSPVTSNNIGAVMYQPYTIIVQFNDVCISRGSDSARSALNCAAVSTSILSHAESEVAFLSQPGLGIHVPIRLHVADDIGRLESTDPMYFNYSKPEITDITDFPLISLRYPTSAFITGVNFGVLPPRPTESEKYINVEMFAEHDGQTYSTSCSSESSTSLALRVDSSKVEDCTWIWLLPPFTTCFMLL